MPDPVPDPAPPPDLPAGKTVGEFEVLRKLGQGGMGAVYLARQRSLKREVALKILRKDLADNPTASQRFQAEAEAVARVTHANIVQVYAVGEEDGLRYMALEYVDGRNLRDYLARKGPPDLPLALTVMRQVAAALQRASEIGIVHRDIKPENILITRKAEVKVADFGLSRYFATEGQPLNLTQSGMTLGTPLYMSPEQVQGHPVDHRSDIYSFGVTCYHLLAGHPPFTGNSPFEVAVQHVQATPPPLADVRPDLPADLCAIVHKMMAKAPGDRYQSARDVIRDLVKVQKGLALGLPLPAAGGTLASVPAAPVAALSGFTTQSLPPVQAPPFGGKFTRRAAGVALLALLAAGGWWAFGRANPPGETKPTAGPGLPDVRPPELVASTRERELKAKIESRQSKPPEVLDAALSLGVLYVRERRLGDADGVFKEIEAERIERLLPQKGQAIKTNELAGRLGQAVVLAHRDKPKESNDKFEQALLTLTKPAVNQLDKFFLAHPEFTQAVAEAVNRNADNLAPGEKMPARLEWLRTPGGLTRGPKGG